MKFREHDLFYVKENGLKGIVLSIGFDGDCEAYYLVRWDCIPGRTTEYKADECDPIWEVDLIPTPVEINTLLSTLCNHQFVEYTGLRESYQYCKHCNEKKHGN